MSEGGEEEEEGEGGGEGKGHLCTNFYCMCTCTSNFLDTTIIHSLTDSCALIKTVVLVTY